MGAAAAAAEASTALTPVSAQVVAHAFVQQYYHILHVSPALVHRFYQNTSKLARPEEDGSVSVTTTMEAINQKILSLNYDQFRAEIKSVDSQESLNGGVTVLVTGFMTGKDDIPRDFTQSFFLAPQDKGFFVLNDMFRYMKDVKSPEGNKAVVEDVQAPVTPEQAVETGPVQEKHIPEPDAVVAEDSNGEEVYNPPENGELAEVAAEEVAVVEEEEVPVLEVVDDVPEASQRIVESNTKIEELPKKSYASIVMDLKQNGVPFSPPVAPKKFQARSQDQHVSTQPPAASAADTAAANYDAVENNQEEEADGYSIYIKGLPMSAMPTLLEDEFKKFGPIKNGGIQVRSNRGFCFGFVEFEVPEAVQKAIEASPVSIGGRSAVVEEKRSTNSRGNRGRFPMGRGPGFRNDGMRGRSNFSGGRGYNRGGDFGGNRSDYGNRAAGRGGSSNRGGDAYPRPDSNGGRMARGVAVNGTAKNMAPRVPATA